MLKQKKKNLKQKLGLNKLFRTLREMNMWIEGKVKFIKMNDKTGY